MPNNELDGSGKQQKGFYRGQESPDSTSTPNYLKGRQLNENYK
jgi:hypothetical protein